MVDDEDFDYLNQWNWQAHCEGNTVYAQRTCRIEYKKSIKMHRLLLGLTDPKILCDHIDRNGLNNQRENLRKCSPSENQSNRASAKKSTSMYLGVSRHISKSVFVSKGKTTYYKTYRWRASITVNKKRIYLGVFTTQREAAQKRDEHAKIHHKEFANLNFK